MAAFVTVKLSQFFDRRKVLSRISAKEAKVLSGTGAYGRKAVRNSIRKAGKKVSVSAPGTPPRFHTRGTASLKDGIFFGYDRRKGSVVIGPRLLNAKGSGKGNSVVYRLSGVKSIPELLEKGGVKTILGRGRGRNAQRFGEPVRQVYKPRPFVGESTSAFQNTQKKLRDLMKTTKL